MSTGVRDAEDEALTFVRVQPHWTSAYDGYGQSSLDTDVGEMSALVEHIRNEDGKRQTSSPLSYTHVADTV